MRILHFAQNVAGGISSYFDEIADHQLKRHGKGNVVFLMPRVDMANLSHVPLECVEPFDHIERNPTSLFRLALLVRRYCEVYRPDIVHLHSTFAGMIFRAVLPFLKHRPKVVYCAHGWAFAREQSALASFVYARLEALMMRLTDVCINISENEARLAARYRIPLTRCVTVPNGISPSPSVPAKRTPAPADGIDLLFVGRHDPQKGIDILLDAMKRVSRSDIRLTVAGASVVSKAKLDLSCLPPAVTLLGHVTRSEVASLMQGCDAIVVPSRWEGFGLVVIEAMRVGRPAIVSPNGALPDLVEDGRTGLVVRDLSPEGLAQMIDELDANDLVRMGKEATQRFRRLYTSDDMNAKIDAVYDRLVPREARAAAIASQSAPKMSRV